MILVTGGAGFIGSNFVLNWFSKPSQTVGIINVDKLTYSGNLQNLASLQDQKLHIFVQADIADFDKMIALLRQYRPTAIVNFAAESHVDRSIHGPADFVQTNVVGTFQLLEAARAYYAELTLPERERFRFLHVSTDEVYGSLGESDPAFHEKTPYAPNSPYSATKAASDHLVRSYHHTYKLPVLTTNCSNNYGPFQFPEKLIPLMIHNCLNNKTLPVYGNGQNVRDWLYVIDHCTAIEAVLAKGRIGEVYNVGGNSEIQNIEVVNKICDLLNELRPSDRSYHQLIQFVQDRPGHDQRYAINSAKIQNELGWKPTETFESGLRKTVQWYLDHVQWTEQIASGQYRTWIDQNYGGRK